MSTETTDSSATDAATTAETDGPGDGLLVVRNLTKEFGGLTAVNDLSFSVQEGEILGIVGPNGAGKSTTFDCITGTDPPTRGTVYYRGEDVTGRSTTEIAKRGLARTVQNARPLGDRTVVENVQLGLVSDHPLSFLSVQDRTRRKAELICERVGLGERFERTPDELARGGLLRLAIGRALATNPDLLLVDEPFAGLDDQEVQGVSELFFDLRDAGLTIVVGHHNVGDLLELVDRGIVVSSGSRIAEGTPEEIRNDPQVRAAYLGGDGS